MIRIDRTTDLSLIREMTKHFVLGEGNQLETFVRQLGEYLLNRPDSILIVGAWDDGNLVGFVIAEQTPGTSVWITQAWTSSDVSWRVADELMGRVVLWALATGRTSITARTQRSAKALSRRFKFEESAVIIEHHIDQDILPVMLKTIREETNGRTLSV